MMDTEFDVCEEFEIEEVTGVEPYLYEPRRKEGRDGGSGSGEAAVRARTPSPCAEPDMRGVETW